MFDSEGQQKQLMSAATLVDLIDKTAGEAFLHLATAADRFERYEHPHAERIAAIADEIGKSFHLARHDRGSLRVAALLHELGEVSMERDYIQRSGSMTEVETIDMARQAVIGDREGPAEGDERASYMLVRTHHEC